MIKNIIRFLYLFLVLYLMNFIFEDLLIHLAINNFKALYKNSDTVNINFYIDLVTYIFAAIYLIFEITSRILKKRFLIIISIFLDFVIFALSIIYFIRIIAAMIKVPGEAGFGLFLLPAPIIIFPFCILDIIEKTKQIFKNK